MFQTLILLFQMVENKSVVKSLNFFYKIIGDLENIEVKINDKDKPLLFLISLHRLFEHFKDVLIYRKKRIISLDEV